MAEPHAEDIALLNDLWCGLRIHNSDDLERACEQLVAHANRTMRGTATVRRIPVGTSHNGWVVPQRWHLRHVEIVGPGGEIALPEHPLVVWPYSAAVDAEMDRDELLDHVAWRDDQPSAVEFRFRLMYRHWEAGWGLSLPANLVSKLPAGRYTVRIDAERTDDPMPLFEYRLPGRSDRTVVLAAHLDHPGQVNDSLSGCMAALQALRDLEERQPSTFFSYAVLLVPEVIGTAVHLATDPTLAAEAWLALCPNMTSHDAPIAVCRSKDGTSHLDVALAHVLRARNGRHVVAPFSTYPDCGDEICFDTVGYRIPTSTVSRIGDLFAHYHTSLDDLPSFLDPESIARHRDVVETITEALVVLERDWEPRPLFEGLPCLSNPDIDLYLGSSNINNVIVPENAFLNLAGESVNARKFMELVLDALGHGGVSVLEIAQAADLPFDLVDAYLEGFRSRGLVEAAPVDRRTGFGWTSGVAIR